jgi:hypothetical protein
MVCAHCGSESHRAGHSACVKYCTLCNEPGLRQKGAECKFRVCSKCGASGHSATECKQTGCSECGSTTHQSAMSFACPERKCSNCEGTLEPKGHNRNDCPRMETTICDECGETGHSANNCPIRPCNTCGIRSHKLPTSHLQTSDDRPATTAPIAPPPPSEPTPPKFVGHTSPNGEQAH